MYELIIDDKISVVENNEIIEQYENEKIEGNIYVGIVKRVVNAMDACFVDIGEKRTALLRNNKFKANDRIIVQVKKAPEKQKGAIVSEKIQLTGKYIILLPTENYISVSSKITDDNEATRLKEIVKDTLNGYGAIIRTNAQNEEQNILNEIPKLISLWESIKTNSNIGLIYQETPIKRIVKDLTDKKISKIITNKKEEVLQILKELEFNILIEEGTRKHELMKKTVWLKSGAFITIEQTEALVVIDVNSGSFISKNSLEETAEKINKEATVEIAKQIRLRNLRGIIIIDYINLKNNSTKEEITNLMKQEVKKDRSKVDVLGFTSLGLLELTRKQL